MTQELKPLNCPFCGYSTPKLMPPNRGSGSFVCCGGCNASMFAMTEEEALKAWNQRVTPRLNRNQLIQIMLKSGDLKKGENIPDMMARLSDAILAAEKDLRHG